MPTLSLQNTWRKKRFESQKNAVNHFTSNALNPDFQKNLDKSLHPLNEMDPKIAGMLKAKLAESAAFLQSKIPVVYPGQKSPSRSDMEKYNRYCQAVDDPSRVLKDAMRGIPNYEAAEVLRNLYPEKHKELLCQVYEKLHDKIEDMPPQKQLLLSLALGSPVSSIMRPEYLQMLQNPISAPQAPTANPMRAAKAISKNMTKMPAMEMTTGQRIASRSK